MSRHFFGGEVVDSLRELTEWRERLHFPPTPEKAFPHCRFGTLCTCHTKICRFRAPIREFPAFGGTFAHNTETYWNITERIGTLLDRIPDTYVHYGLILAATADEPAPVRLCTRFHIMSLFTNIKEPVTALIAATGSG